jgi:hypothetical protein
MDIISQEPAFAWFRLSSYVNHEHNLEIITQYAHIPTDMSPGLASCDAPSPSLRIVDIPCFIHGSVVQQHTHPEPGRAR